MIEPDRRTVVEEFPAYGYMIRFQGGQALLIPNTGVSLLRIAAQVSLLAARMQRRESSGRLRAWPAGMDFAVSTLEYPPVRSGMA